MADDRRRERLDQSLPMTPLLDDDTRVRYVESKVEFNVRSAIEKNNYDALKSMIDEGVNTSLLNNDYVCMATADGKARILTLLLDNGADPYERDMTDPLWPRYPIHLAAGHGQLECLQILLDRGVNVDCLDSDLRSALHWATCYGRMAVVEALIARGASVNLSQNDGFTPLHAATCLGHVDICRRLVDGGALVDAADDGGWTALHAAACYGYLHIVRVLVTAGAAVDQRTADEETALHIACSSGYEEIAKHLYDNGAAVDVFNSNGYTPFHLSVYYSKPRAVQFLISTNACMDTRDTTGQSPLSLAVSRGEEKILLMMFNAGCRVTSAAAAKSYRSPELSELVSYLAVNPRSLKELCCFKIRSILGPTVFDDVRVLPVPDSVKDFIALKHVECKNAPRYDFLEKLVE